MLNSMKCNKLSPSNDFRLSALHQIINVVILDWQMNMFVLDAPLNALINAAHIALLLCRIAVLHQQRVGSLDLRATLLTEFVLLQILIECCVQFMSLDNGEL